MAKTKSKKQKWILWAIVGVNTLMSGFSGYTFYHFFAQPTGVALAMQNGHTKQISRAYILDLISKSAIANSNGKK